MWREQDYYGAENKVTVMMIVDTEMDRFSTEKDRVVPFFCLEERSDSFNKLHPF